MKIITTEFREQEALSWEELEHFLNEGIYEEGFVVLNDDHNSNYIQMGEMEVEDDYKWGLEVRVYAADNVSFEHYRMYFDAPEEAIELFKAFYHNEPIDFKAPNWINITDTF